VAIASGQTPFLDVAMVLALMAFLAAIGFARYLEKGGTRDD
jgi:multicomponent Na+:H+ antiporter subunit F